MRVVLKKGRRPSRVLCRGLWNRDPESVGGMLLTLFVSLFRVLAIILYIYVLYGTKLSVKGDTGKLLSCCDKWVAGPETSTVTALK